MLTHLATGEMYTSSQYHWVVGQTAICKFVPQVCRAILAEFQDEYLHCPISSNDWKRVGEKFRSRWIVSLALGALDGKHLAMKQPQKSGSDFYNYKGFFSQKYYKNTYSSGSMWGLHQMHRFSKEEIRGRLPPPKPHGEGGLDFHYFSHV